MSPSDATIAVRPATPADAPIIALHRARMFREMGQIADGPAFEALVAAVTDYLSEGLPSGEYLGWLAVAGDEVVAGAGVHLRRIVPRPGPGGDGPLVATARQALVVNVWTEPAWRRRGAAEGCMRALLAWARDVEVTGVVLHASDAGRPLYERLGFRPTNEMRYDAAADPAAPHTMIR